MLPIELQPYHAAILLVYQAAHYVGKVAYAGGDEFLFKIALESELKIRFQQWSTQHNLPAPFLQTEAVLAYQFPTSGSTEVDCLPPCTHLRADIWIYSSVPEFPSLVIELKSVDKMQTKHRRQAHQYFTMMKRVQPAICFQPKLALVINFRGFYCKEFITFTAKGEEESFDNQEETNNQEVTVLHETTTTKRKRKSAKEAEDLARETEITEVCFTSCKQIAEESRKLVLKTFPKLVECDNSESFIQFAAGLWTPFVHSKDIENQFSESIELMKWWGIVGCMDEAKKKLKQQPLKMTSSDS